MVLREKVFLVEGRQDPNVLCQVAQAFFVWNDGVQIWNAMVPRASSSQIASSAARTKKELIIQMGRNVRGVRTGPREIAGRATSCTERSGTQECSSGVAD